MDDATRGLLKSAVARLKRERSGGTARGGQRRIQVAGTKLQPPPRKVTRPASPMQPEMVEIPSGPFLMGTSPEQAQDICREYGNWSAEFFAREQPQREMALDRYWIDKFPVTNAQYKTFIDDTGHPVPHRPTPAARSYNWDTRTREYPFPRGWLTTPLCW